MKSPLWALVFLTFFLSQIAPVQAASLYIDPAFSKLYRGDAVKLAVRLDTNEESGECVNAVDGVITYSENISPVDVSIGDSIFSIWVEQPVINKENRTITFAGGIPNGYCGRIAGDPRLTNTILEIIVRSPGFTIGGDEGGDAVATVDFAPETTAYLNDGFGTKASLGLFGAQLELDKLAGTVLVDPWREQVAADDIAPEEFGISLERDRLAFGGKYFIVFNTTDKQTGIDHYEVIEEPIAELGNFAWGRADAPWIVARSPYTLKDQSLNSVIRVKAIDKAGNEYIATLIPEEANRSLSTSQLLLLAAGFLLFVFVAAIGFTGVRAYRRREKTVAETESADDEIIT